MSQGNSFVRWDRYRKCFIVILRAKLRRTTVWTKPSVMVAEVYTLISEVKNCHVSVNSSS